MITDIHFHLAGIRNGPHIFLSQQMRDTVTFRLLTVVLLLRKARLSNHAALEWATEVIRESAEVQKVVALALDWVYDKNGNRNTNRTHLWVGNRLAAGLAKRMPDKVLFGASVNPNRPDALCALKKVKAEGAVLIKLIPSVQDIDLTDPSHKPFFQRMADLQLPLLCHVGVEHTIPPVDMNPEKQRLNDPARLEAILKMNVGVKVIAAHCGLSIGNEDGEQAYNALVQLYGNNAYKEFLYADVSAFFVPFSPLRRRLAKRVKGELPHERLILGSDFPMLPSPLLGGNIGDMKLLEAGKVLVKANPLDRNFRALRALGFQDCVFSNAERVLAAH